MSGLAGVKSDRLRAGAPGGEPLTYEIDVLGDGLHDLIVFECKDWSRTIIRDSYAYFVLKVEHLAEAHPERSVTGVFVSPREPTAFGRTVVSRDSSGPGSNVSALHLLKVEPRLVGSGRHFLMREILGEDRLLIVRRGPRVHDLDVLEQRMRREPDRDRRLDACLEIMSRNAPLALLAEATLEAARCFHYSGAASDARETSRELSRLSRAITNRSQAEFFDQAGWFWKRMSDLRELRTRRNSSGATVVARMHAALRSLHEVHQISVLHVTGHWHGVAGNPQRAKQQLAEAERRAEREIARAGTYGIFLARIRLAEIAQGDDRLELLESASGILPDIGPRYRGLAATSFTAAAARVDGTATSNNA